MTMRWVEFFEGDDYRLSMTRLLCFMSFFPASWVVMTKGNEGILGWYLSAYVLGYVGGKCADVLGKPRNAAAPSNVTINQPEKVNVSGS